MAAVLMALLRPSTVLLGLAGTVTVVPLITTVLFTVRSTGAKVPCMVGQAVFHSSLPTSTQVL